MVYMYLHLLKTNINHPNVGKYTHFSHGWYGLPNTQPIPPILERRIQVSANVARGAPRSERLRERSALRGRFRGRPRFSSLTRANKASKKSGPKKHVFIIFLLGEAARSNWIWVGAGYVFFWKMISDLMNWWFDTLMIGEGWWVMGDDEEEIVHMFDSRSLRSN